MLLNQKKNMNPKVDLFFDKPTKWQQEYLELRNLILDCFVAEKESELTEELKWGCPCYTLQTNGKLQSNIVLIHGFKNYCALLFMQGALLKDVAGILVQQTENVQSARQIRFTNINEILKSKAILQDYLLEAIEIAKSGLKAASKVTIEYKIPEEFENVLNDMPELKKAFNMLTPGRQRGYLLYFSAPKQSKTKEARIEKYVQHILNGKGLEDN